VVWFVKKPLLLEAEEEALTLAGYDYRIDELAKREGRLVIEVDYSHPYLGDKEKHTLKCYYPAAYPYFAVEVQGASLPPGRHINPVDHRLCLYEDVQNSWDPSSDTLAKALGEQVPIILERHINADTPSEDEEQVGYQVTGQLLYEKISVLYINDTPIPDSVSHGKMYLKLHADYSLGKPIVGFLESIENRDEVIAITDESLDNIFTKECMCRWVKLNSLPNTISESILLEEAGKIFPAIKTPKYSIDGTDIVGLLIPEESEYRVPVYNWIFIVRRRPKNKKQNKHKPEPVFVRSDRYTKSNIRKRIPRLNDLLGKHVTLIGVGALGSQIAWQLVRSGIDSLTLIDCDVVLAGNLPRWLLGFSAIGMDKVHAVAIHLVNNYPGVKCKIYNLRIGHGHTITLDNVPYDAHEFLCQSIKESDLVVDAAAETNISLYLSNTCEEQGIPYVWATGTRGAWGGIVGRVIPGATEGNWTDFSYMYSAGEITPPPEEVNSDVQNAGCFSPTFTGSGFDMDHISIMATRVAVATLCQTGDSYPDFDWDVGVLHLWDENSGLPIAPKWETYKLKSRASSEPA